MKPRKCRTISFKSQLSDLCAAIRRYLEAHDRPPFSPSLIDDRMRAKDNLRSVLEQSEQVLGEPK